MKTLIFTTVILFAFVSKAIAQTDTACPTVTVTVKLALDTFKFGKDILVNITLTNKSDTIQSVWFDKHKLSTGGPAWTSVTLTNKKTGKSVLKYRNKAILESQLYSEEDLKRYSYYLEPGEKASGQFSLFDLVVLLDYKRELAKGDYKMQIFYCNNSSNQISFTVN